MLIKETSEPTTVQFVLTREGVQIPFDKEKIVKAIDKAGQATGEFGLDESRTIADSVVKVLSHRFNGQQIPTVEQIQDIVEQELISANYFQTARAYIVYREKRSVNRQDRQALVDVTASINEYLDRSDWRVRANANQGYSLGGLILNISGKMIANYWLNHIYPREVGEAHRVGDYHIHDLDMLSGYCAGWSLKTLLREGFNGVPNKTESKPPRHLVSAFSQMVNFLGNEYIISLGMLKPENAATPDTPSTKSVAVTTPYPPQL